MPPSSAEDHVGKLQLCSKYLETFTRAKEREKCFAELSIDLLIGMRDVISTDRMVSFCPFYICPCYRVVVLPRLGNYTFIPNTHRAIFCLQYYQTLFCEGECFLHIVSLLNGSLDEENGERLVLNVLETLTSLLCGNVVSKVTFIFVFLVHVKECFGKMKCFLFFLVLHLLYSLISKVHFVCIFTQKITMFMVYSFIKIIR